MSSSSAFTNPLLRGTTSQHPRSATLPHSSLAHPDLRPRIAVSIPGRAPLDLHKNHTLLPPLPRPQTLPPPKPHFATSHGQGPQASSNSRSPLHCIPSGHSPPPPHHCGPGIRPAAFQKPAKPLPPRGRVSSLSDYTSARPVELDTEEIFTSFDCPRSLQREHVSLAVLPTSQLP